MDSSETEHRSGQHFPGRHFVLGWRHCVEQLLARGARILPCPALLSSAEVRETQAWLKVLGFDPGPIDGARGPQTKAAVLRYQAARQREETGELDVSFP